MIRRNEDPFLVAVLILLSVFAPILLVSQPAHAIVKTNLPMPFGEGVATRFAPSGYYYVGAQAVIASNTGVRGTLQVQSISVPTGCLSFWVSEDASNNVWMQVGYYICSGSTPVAYYQIWNLASSTVLTSGTASVTNGNHVFALQVSSGTTWAFSLDGVQFGTYNVGASASLSTYPVQSMSEEGGYGPSSFTQESFPIAMQYLSSGVWLNPQSATAYVQGGTWGIQGQKQNAALAADSLLIGGSLAVQANGVSLWSSSTVVKVTSPPKFGVDVGPAVWSFAANKISWVSGTSNTTLTLPKLIIAVGPTAVPATKCSVTFSVTFTHNSTTYIWTLVSANAVLCGGSSITPVMHIYVKNVTGMYNQKEIIVTGTSTRLGTVQYVQNQINFALTSNQPASICDTTGIYICTQQQFSGTAFDWTKIASSSTYNNSTKILASVSNPSTSVSISYIFDPLAIDGSASKGCHALTCAVTITTAYSPDVLICSAELYKASYTFTIADTSLLSWTNRSQAGHGTNGYGGSQKETEWYAIASGILTTDVITVTSGTSGAYIGLICNGISGANTASPFDSNAAIPRSQTNIGCSSIPCNTGVYTSNANDFIETMGSDTQAQAQAAGSCGSSTCTLIADITNPVDAYAEYLIVSSTQSNQAFALSHTISGTWGVITDAIKQYTATTVTMPIKLTVANSGPSGTFSISGCAVSNATLSADSYTHTYLSVTASCSITVTAPAAGTYTIYVFRDDTTLFDHNTWTISTCASGTCSLASNTTYYWLKNNYTLTPQTPSTWDGVYAETLSITYMGVSTSMGQSGTGTGNCFTGSTAPLTTANGGGAITCIGWADYNTAVGAPTTINTNWIAQAPYTFTDTTGGNTHNVNYQKLVSLSRTITETFSFSATYTARDILPRGDSVTLPFSVSYAVHDILGRAYAATLPFSVAYSKNVDLIVGYAVSLPFSVVYSSGHVLQVLYAATLPFSVSYAIHDILGRTYSTSLPFSVSYLPNVNLLENYAATLPFSVSYGAARVLQVLYDVTLPFSIVYNIAICNQPLCGGGSTTTTTTTITSTITSTTTETSGAGPYLVTQQTDIGVIIVIMMAVFLVFGALLFARRRRQSL